jgi:hypothetical protein
VIYAIIGIAVVLWVGRKMRPAHLGNDVLKFQIFNFLRMRNAREAANDLKYESLERRLWLQISGSIAFVYASSFLSLKDMGLSWMYCIVMSLIPSTIFGIMSVRFSRTYRLITLPLFATLCRMPQSRWDMTANPRMWVKVDLKKGRALIKLPKDWHAHKAQLKVIQDLIGTRLPGQWKMEADTRKFLLVFTLESEAETIEIPVPPKPEPEFSDSLDFTAIQKVTDNEPW